jgi:hypothetical protein
VAEDYDGDGLRGSGYEDQLGDARQTRREIAAAIRAFEPASGEYVLGWRTMDSAPKDGTELLAWWSAGEVHGVVHWSEGWWVENGDLVSPPTHWKPLDAGPTMLTAASSNGSGK